jgi:hypothetical protein
MFPVASVTLSLFLAAANTNTPAASASAHSSSCRASLTVADARALVLQTPNSRAFIENQSAKLKAALEERNPDGTVTLRVTNEANEELVGLYTVNLRTGTVLDDDQEPAEDAQTRALRQRLMAKHCAR